MLGFDIDQQKVDKLKSGSSHLEHIPPARIVALSERRIRGPIDFAGACEVDAERKGCFRSLH